MDPPPPPNPAGSVQSSNSATLPSSLSILHGYSRPTALANGLPDFAVSSFKFGAAMTPRKDPNALLASKIQNINNQAESKEKNPAVSSAVVGVQPELVQKPAEIPARPSTAMDRKFSEIDVNRDRLGEIGD